MLKRGDATALRPADSVASPFHGVVDFPNTREFEDRLEERIRDKPGEHLQS